MLESVPGRRLAALLAIALAASPYRAVAGEGAAGRPRERPGPGPAGGATVREASLPRPPGVASTPRDALVLLEAAARSGDPERTAPLFAEPFGSALRRTFDAGNLIIDASRRLNAVVLERMGADAVRSLGLDRRARGPAPIPTDDRIEIVTIVQSGESARAVIRPRTRYGPGREESIELVRQEGAWKLLPPAHDGREFDEMDLLQMELLTRGLENAAAALVKLASDVEHGSVATIADCRERLEEADLEVGRSLGDPAD